MQVLGCDATGTALQACSSSQQVPILAWLWGLHHAFMLSTYPHAEIVLFFFSPVHLHVGHQKQATAATTATAATAIPKLSTPFANGAVAGQKLLGHAGLCGKLVKTCKLESHSHIYNQPFPESACEGFFVKKHLQNYVSSTSSHLHLCTSTFSPISRLIFTSTFTTAHLHLCTSSHPHIDISAHLHLHTSTSLLMFTSARLYRSLLIFTSSHLHLTSLPLIYISHLHLSLFLTFSLKAEGSAAGPPRNAPSAEIVRVECAKCRRECDLVLSGATLCGDRACRVREMQARVRFVRVAGNPLRRSCVSSARSAGESAICGCRGQPSAEIVRVECAKCRRECDLCLSGATLCGDRALCSTTLVRGAICGAGS